MGSDYIIGKLRTPLTRIDNNRESQSASKDWTRTSNYLVRYVKFFFCLFLATNANACVDSAYRICLALVESSALELSVVVGVTAVVSGVRGLLYPGFMQDLVRLDFPKANIKDLGLDIARGVQDMLVATSALRLYNAMSPLHTEHNHNHNHEAEHKNSCAALCLAAVGVGIAAAHLTVKYATKLAQPQAAPDDLESSPRPSAFPSAASTVPACCTGLQK